MKRAKIAVLAVGATMTFILAGCSQDEGVIPYADKNGKPPAGVAAAEPGDIHSPGVIAVGPGGSAAGSNTAPSAGNIKKMKK